MANYVEKARAVLDAMAARATPDSPDEPGSETLPKGVGAEIVIPSQVEWPESLSGLAAEVGQHSGDADSARREIWVEWCEWKVAALNRLFQEQGLAGEPGKITSETVRHGECKGGVRPSPASFGSL
jgi:hypothetical protein